MTNRAAMLRREPEDGHRATFLDLFFDLVFVFALFQLSHGLLAHLRWSGAFQTAVLLLAVWLVWNHTAGIGDRYDTRRPVIQLLVIGSMFGAFVLAVTVPEAFGARGPVFAGAYVAVQAGRGLFLVVITRGGGRRPDARLLFWFSVSALPWLAGAVVQGWARGVLWALAVAVDYTASWLGWPTPGLGRGHAAEFTISGEFVAERHRQFFIVALGELILVTGLAVTSSSRFGGGREAAVVVVTFASTVLLWRIYIYRAGEILGAAVAAAPDPLRVALSGVYAHPVMVIGLVAISAGDELAVRHPAGHIRPAWIAVIFGGPALFLAGRAILEYVVFSRVSPDRVIGILVLAAVSPAMILASPLLAALAAAVVLGGVAIADTARARRHPDEPPSPRSVPARTAVRAPSRPRNDERMAGNWIWARTGLKTTNRTAALLRGSEDPRQATFLDLFFDLAFVFALFQVSHGLLEHLSWSGAFQTTVLLLAVWLVWNHTAGIGDRYDPGQPVIQLLVIGSMFGAFVLAAAVPEAFGTRGPVFAGAYVAVQAGRGLFLVLVTRGDKRPPEVRRLFWFGVSALLWLAGAAAQGWARAVLWALAVAADYTVPRLGWPAPGIGRASAEELGIAGEFLAERQRQFFIIALGELILVTGLTVTSSSLGADRQAAAAVTFATTVLLWRIYIYRAGEVMGPAVAAAPDPFRVALSALYGHPAMVAGLVAISAGDDLAITHPAGHTKPAWIAVILGGPALFLAGRAIFEYAVFSRVSPDRAIGILVLAAVSPAMIFAPPLLAALAAAVILAGVAITDTALTRRHPDEPPSPPSGRPS